MNNIKTRYKTNKIEKDKRLLSTWQIAYNILIYNHIQSNTYQDASTSGVFIFQNKRKKSAQNLEEKEKHHIFAHAYRK